MWNSSEYRFARLIKRYYSAMLSLSDKSVNHHSKNQLPDTSTALFRSQREANGGNHRDFVFAGHLRWLVDQKSLGSIKYPFIYFFLAFFVVLGDLGTQIIAKMFSIDDTSSLRTWVVVILAIVCVLPLGELS